MAFFVWLLALYDSGSPSSIDRVATAALELAAKELGDNKAYKDGRALPLCFSSLLCLGALCLCRVVISLFGEERGST